MLRAEVYEAVTHVEAR